MPIGMHIILIGMFFKNTYQLLVLIHTNQKT
jgi:hypothetical protein